jgi:hypothetical protein
MGSSKMMQPGRSTLAGNTNDDTAQRDSVGKRTLTERAYGNQPSGGDVGGSGPQALAQARAEIERLIHGDPHKITDAETVRIVHLLRMAGVSTPGLIVAQNVLRAYWNLFWLRHQGGPTFDQDIAVYRHQLALATQLGVLSGPGAKESEDRAAAWKHEYAPKTPAQVTAANRARNAAAADVFEQATAVLAEAQDLRQWVDKEHGWIGVGWGIGSVIVRCVGALADTGGVLGGAAQTLQDKLALPDTDANKRDEVKVAIATVDAQLKQLRHKGGNAATDLAALREGGFELLDRAASAAGFIPGIGKPLSVALTATEATLRYASGDWTASEAVVKTLVSVVSAKFGEQIAGEGSLAAQSLRTFAFKAIAGATGELTGILTNRELTAEQRTEAVKAAIAKCIAEAFVEAITRITGGAIKLRSAEEGREAYVFLHEAAVKLGVVQLVYGPLEELKNAWKEK